MVSPRSIVTLICLINVSINGYENVESPPKLHGCDADCVDVSSKIDFDLDDMKEPRISMGEARSTFSSVNGKRAVTTTGSPFRFPTRTGDSKAQFTRTGSHYGPVRRKRVNLSRNHLEPTPTVINNIRIVVNENEIVPRLDGADRSCQNDVCNVTVFSKLDADGNLVTDVHLSIVSNLALVSGTKINVGDVPIVSGFRGTDLTPDNEPPYSRPTYPSKFPYLPVSRNIPQVQTRGHRDWSTNEVGFQPRGGFNHWSSQQFPRYDPRWNGHRESQAPTRSWQPLVAVDDKIDAPFRKTDSSSATT